MIMLSSLFAVLKAGLSSDHLDGKRKPAKQGQTKRAKGASLGEQGTRGCKHWGQVERILFLPVINFNIQQLPVFYVFTDEVSDVAKSGVHSAYSQCMTSGDNMPFRATCTDYTGSYLYIK